MLCLLLFLVKKSEDFFGYDKSVFGGDFILEKDGQIFKFDNKIMNYVFVGLQIINPEILKKSPEKCFSMFYFYKSAVGDNGMLSKIKGIELSGKYFHISNPKILEEVNQNQKILT